MPVKPDTKPITALMGKIQTPEKTGAGMGSFVWRLCRYMPTAASARKNARKLRKSRDDSSNDEAHRQNGTLHTSRGAVFLN